MQFAWDGQRLADGDQAASTLTSPFTHAIVVGLRTGEAAPQSDTISVDQLYQFVARKVPEKVANMSPQRFVDDGSGELIIARNPRPEARLPAEIVAALDDDDVIKRVGAVAELGRLMAAPDAQLASAAASLLRSRESSETHVHVARAIDDALEEPPPASPSPRRRGWYAIASVAGLILGAVAVWFGDRLGPSSLVAEFRIEIAGPD